MATTSRADNALPPTIGGLWHGAIADLTSFTGLRAPDKEVPSDEEEEELDTAAQISAIKQSAVRLMHSRSLDRKRDLDMIAPRRATVVDFIRQNEQRRYDSARNQSKSWEDRENIYSLSPSFGDKSTEILTGSVVSDTFSPPSQVQSEGAYTGFAGSGWFSDNIVAISKVKDSGTENTSQSTIFEDNRSTSFASNISGKRVSSEQHRSSLFPMCVTTQRTLPSEESEQQACFTFVSSHPIGGKRCIIAVVIIGIVFLAVPLISLAAMGYLRDRDNNGKSARAASSTSNPSMGSDAKEDIFRYRVPHTVGGE
jgi:hypothetical protein